MATETFENVEDIEAHYRRLMRQEDDDDKLRELRLEQRERMAEFREKQANREALEHYRARVVAEKGLGDYADLITGGTPEEIDAKAATAVKLMGTQDPQAAAMYGGGASSGGGTPPPPQKVSRVEFEEEFSRAYNNGEPLNRADIDRFVQQRLGSHVARFWKDAGLRRWQDKDIDSYYREEQEPPANLPRAR